MHLLPSQLRGGGKLVSVNTDEPKVEERRETTRPQQIGNPKRSEVMDFASNMMDEVSGGIGGEKKCFWWPEVKGLELLGCVYTNELNRIFLFHWDVRNQLHLPEQLNPIASFSYGSSGAQMTLKDNKTVKMTPFVKLMLAKLHKWKVDLFPEQHCWLTGKGHTNDYTLTCDNKTKNILGKELVGPVILESISDKYKEQVA